MNYIDGEKHGEDKSYYDNGQLASSSNYIDGEKHGEHKRYRENGELESTRYFNALAKRTTNNDNDGSPTSCVVCSKKIYPNSGTGNYYFLYYF